MNFYDAAVTLISENHAQNPRIIQADTPDGTKIVRIIVGEEDMTNDLVLFNPEPHQISHLKNLVAEARMRRARAAMINEKAWRVPNAPKT